MAAVTIFCRARYPETTRGIAPHKRQELIVPPRIDA